MQIIPAIDLQQGRCVRLKQGQFEQVTQFADEPVARAQYFSDLGVNRLHIVDLDGAKSGAIQQLPLIKSMKTDTLNLQIGGGIRTLNSAQACIDAGVSQLVLGSIAVTSLELTQEIISIIGTEKIILAFDVRIENNIPHPATHGWQQKSTKNLWDLVGFYQDLGINTILCTDIACDGMMSGPNFSLYEEACTRFPDIIWQASGGIRSQEDIEKLDNAGVKGAILGLTLYQNNFDLSACLKEYASC